MIFLENCSVEIYVPNRITHSDFDHGESTKEQFDSDMLFL